MHAISRSRKVINPKPAHQKQNKSNDDNDEVLSIIDVFKLIP